VKKLSLKIYSIKMRQLRKIDLTLSWKTYRSEHNSQISEIDLGSIHGKLVNGINYIQEIMKHVKWQLRNIRRIQTLQILT